MHIPSFCGEKRATPRIYSPSIKKKKQTPKNTLAKKSELIIQGARDNVTFGNAIKKEETLQAGEKTSTPVRKGNH